METSVPRSRPFASGWRAALARSLEATVAAVALGYILLYLVLAAHRVPYRYELEWLEGGMVHEVQRVMHGQPIYAEPTIEYAPFIYTPLFYYICVPFAALIGPGFSALRVVSLLASLGVFALLFLISRRETGSRLAGLLAAGLYAATYRLGGAWFDVARVDSVLLLLLLASVYVGRFHQSMRAAVWQGVLLSAAFLTKQSSVVVIAPIMLHAILYRRRQGLVTAAVLAGILGLSSLILNTLNNGWYWYYFVEATTVSGITESVWITFWTEDIARSMGVASVLALLALGAEAGRESSRTFVFYLGVTIGLLVMCWASRLHIGGYDNVMMPTYAWIALLASVGTHRILGWLEPQPESLRASVGFTLYFVLLLQFALLVYDPMGQLPTAEDEEAGDRIMDLIEKTDGPVFMPFHCYLPALVGKSVYANRSGIKGILDDETHPLRAQFMENINEAIKSKHFKLVISDNGRFLASELRDYYTQLPISYTSAEAFYPVTGVRTRPVCYYIPKE